jgi:hypothetical protein
VSHVQKIGDDGVTASSGLFLDLKYKQNSLEDEASFVEFPAFPLFWICHTAQKTLKISFEIISSDMRLIITLCLAIARFYLR